MGAAVGFVLISLSITLINRSNRTPTLERPLEVHQLIVALVLLGLVVPLAGFVLLRVCRIRPAAIAAIAGWLATIVVSGIVRVVFLHGVGPALVYGLCAAACYGCAVAVSSTPQ